MNTCSKQQIFAHCAQNVIRWFVYTSSFHYLFARNAKQILVSVFAHVSQDITLIQKKDWKAGKLMKPPSTTTTARCVAAKRAKISH
jgi:hypothetical protein